MVAASRENELRVTVLGLRPYAVRLFLFAAAAVLAAVAGIGFLLLQSAATPRISTSDFTLTLLVIVVLGGVGYRWGAIVGGIIYTVLDQRLSALAGSDLDPGAAGCAAHPALRAAVHPRHAVRARRDVRARRHRRPRRTAITRPRSGKKDAAAPAVLQDLEA